MNDAIQKATLIAFAEGRVSHLNHGLCPDQVAGHDSRDPNCQVCQALSAPSSEQAQQGANTAVYLVATGELHEGEETYTRHEDHPLPMCDFERLWMDRPAAPAVGVTELIALADAYAETRHALGPAEHSGTTNTSRNVLRTALAGAAQEAEPQKYDDTLLPFLGLIVVKTEHDENIDHDDYMPAIWDKVLVQLSAECGGRYILGDHDYGDPVRWTTSTRNSLFRRRATLEGHVEIKRYG